MAINPTYSVGTAAVSAGSAVVNFTGAQIISAGIRVGDVFVRAGLTVTIDSVVSATQITLVQPWPGASGSGAYEIRKTADAVRVMEASRQLTEDLASGNLRALSELPGAGNTLPYFTGPGAAAATPLTALARTLLAQGTPQAVRDALGLAGYAGAGIRVLGSRASVAALPPAAEATLGDAYLVGQNLHIWTGSTWQNAGVIAGAPGASGAIPYATRAAAAAAAPSIATNISELQHRDGSTLVLRSRTAFADDPLFETGARWGVVGRQDTLALLGQITVPLEAVGGTAQAITAHVPAGLVTLGQGDIADGQEFTFTPTAANTGDNPTLRVDRGTTTGTTRGIRTADGAAWPAGRFIVGRTYVLRRVGTLYRVVRGDTTLNRAEMTGTQPMSSVEGLAEALLESGGDKAIVPYDLLESEGAIAFDLHTALTQFPMDAPFDYVTDRSGQFDLRSAVSPRKAVSAAILGRRSMYAPEGQTTTRVQFNAVGASGTRGLVPLIGAWTLVFSHITLAGPDARQEVIFQGRGETPAFNVLVNTDTNAASQFVVSPNSYLLRYRGSTDGGGPWGYPNPTPAEAGKPHVLAIVKRSGPLQSEFWIDFEKRQTFTSPDEQLPKEFAVFSHSAGQVNGSMGPPDRQAVGRIVMIPRALNEADLRAVMAWVGRGVDLTGPATGGGGGGQNVRFVTLSEAEYLGLTEAERNNPAILYLVTL